MTDENTRASLRTQPSDSVVGAERAIRIAIWNAGKNGGMGDDMARALIERAMSEPTMLKALAAQPRDDVRPSDSLAKAAIELLAWYGPFNPTKHPPEINGAWLRLQSAIEALAPTTQGTDSGLAGEPWKLDDPDILDRLREDGYFEAVEEIESLQARCRALAEGAGK